MLKVTPQTMCETIFGLPYPPSSEDLQKQYRKLAKLLHPDKGGDKGEFIRMQDAYKVLKPLVGEDTEGIGLINGLPIETLGLGYEPPMPRCEDCDGLGYQRNVLQVLESFQPCPDCFGDGYVYFSQSLSRCHRCLGKRFIKLVDTRRVNRICKACEGKGQIYMSNPVFHINSMGM